MACGIASFLSLDRAYKGWGRRNIMFIEMSIWISYKQYKYVSTKTKIKHPSCGSPSAGWINSGKYIRRLQTIKHKLNLIYRVSACWSVQYDMPVRPVTVPETLAIHWRWCCVCRQWQSCHLWRWLSEWGGGSSRQGYPSGWWPHRRGGPVYPSAWSLARYAP